MLPNWRALLLVIAGGELFGLALTGDAVARPRRQPTAISFIEPDGGAGSGKKKKKKKKKNGWPLAAWRRPPA